MGRNLEAVGIGREPGVRAGLVPLPARSPEPLRVAQIREVSALTATAAPIPTPDPGGGDVFDRLRQR
jgi:hypothetical protein